jgi:predicted TIM-barrel fold metal-dependent hydrolase
MWKQEDELEYLYSLGLSDDELEKILYKNITKILEENKLLERA